MSGPPPSRIGPPSIFSTLGPPPSHFMNGANPFQGPPPHMFNPQHGFNGGMPPLSMPPPSMTFPFPNQQHFNGQGHSDPQYVYVPVPFPVRVPTTSTDEPKPSSTSRSPPEKDDSDEESKKRSKKSKKKKSSKRKRDRSRSLSPSDEPTRDKKKNKEKAAAPRTLGELVEKVKEEKERGLLRRSRSGTATPDIKNEDQSSASTTPDIPPPPPEGSPPEQNQKAVAAPIPDDDVPRLTEIDFLDPISLDPAPFDPHSMSLLRKNEPSAMPMESPQEYVKDGHSVKSSPDHQLFVSSFANDVIGHFQKGRSQHAAVPHPEPPSMHINCKCVRDDDSPACSSDEGGDSDTDDVSQMNEKQKNELLLRTAVQRKRNHPSALSPDLCFNEPGMMNDGPVCRCATRTRNEGIRHNKFPGEQSIHPCDPQSCNSDRLSHYVLRVSSSIHVAGTRKTTIESAGSKYEFEGFSLFFHRPVPSVLPAMPESRWTTDFDFALVEEPIPQCFTVEELDLFYSFLFDHTLELFDAPLYPSNVSPGDGCPIYHIMPRFVSIRGGVTRLLPMSQVLHHLSVNHRPLFSPQEANAALTCSEDEFRRMVYREKHQLIICPEKKPSAIRIDNLARSPNSKYPLVVQYTVKPAVYANMNNAEMHQLQKKMNKQRHLYGLKRGGVGERETLEELQKQVDALRAQNAAMRNTTVTLPGELFYRTGLMPDIVPHCLVVVLVVHHLRMHWSLELLEDRIGYRFKDRSLLELSLTHPSFKNNYGMTADQAKNALLNCGYKRKLNNGDEKKEKKRGISRLNAIMAKSGADKASISSIPHNERLEYLGDAVVEMIVSNRIFHLLPHHNEGGLATYRSSLVQNRNLASLAKNLGLHSWLLFVHGSDLCHEPDFRHALANAFEAIMAAVYLDDGIDSCDRIFSDAMFGDDPPMKKLWDEVVEHELKRDLPDGDRHLIEKVPSLQKLTELEEAIGVRFKHIRVLAKAFTRRNVPHNDLTRGHNQRLEWLGDTVLQLIVSDYLYRHFPGHHEGHLSLLRTCVVSNKTQSVICDDLSLTEYVMKVANHREAELRTKDKADLVEAFIGALYIDRGWEYCKGFIRICFLPRLKYFITANKWNDAKSQLQQACLALRNLDAKEPEIPVYKVITMDGSTNARRYKVAVYFRQKRLAVGEAGNMHLAEMEAAKNALKQCMQLFPKFEKTSPFDPPSSSRGGPIILPRTTITAKPAPAPSLAPPPFHQSGPVFPGHASSPFQQPPPMLNGGMHPMYPLLPHQMGGAQSFPAISMVPSFAPPPSMNPRLGRSYPQSGPFFCNNR